MLLPGPESKESKTTPTPAQTRAQPLSPALSAALSSSIEAIPTSALSVSSGDLQTELAKDERRHAEYVRAHTTTATATTAQTESKETKDTQQETVPKTEAKREISGDRDSADATQTAAQTQTQTHEYDLSKLWSALGEVCVNAIVTDKPTTTKTTTTPERGKERDKEKDGKRVAVSGKCAVWVRFTVF